MVLAQARMRHIKTSTILSLVWFYGISTIVGYLKPNPVYSYILDIFVNMSTKFIVPSNVMCQ